MSVETALTRSMRGKEQNQRGDCTIGELAERQHGVVARVQLIGLGLGEDSIDRRLSGGRLHRLHRGVYAVGHRAVSRDGRWMASVLACGAGAVLSHRSAAVLWGLQRHERGAIDITTPRSARSRVAIRRHCTKLLPDEMTVRRGIPVTTASRTLLDLAETVHAEALERAVREAEVLRLPLRPSLGELLVRHPRRRGACALRACLRRLELLPVGRTRSRLEDRFLDFVVRFDLPRPQTNVLLDLDDGTIEADCFWRERRLIVELDGHEAHGTRAAFESDRGRDRRLQAAGWTVVRITWRQLHDEPEALLADLRRLLDADKVPVQAE